MENLTLTQRLEIMCKARTSGYNCAQAVVLAFPDITSLDDDSAIKITAAMGGGFGFQGELCGVIAGMAVVVGMVADPNPKKKKEAYDIINRLGSEFAARHQGCRRCPELKDLNPPAPCNILITEGIELLHNYLSPK